MPRAIEVLLVALRLGLTSFGGPIAHIGYFRDEYVTRRQWLSEQRFAELVGLCQFLPGPASSQLGIAIGMGRAGYIGALAAWLGFTLPSAVALILFAYGVDALGGEATEWLHGLKIVAVAVVALALWGMGKTLTPDKPTIAIAIIASAVLLFTDTAILQLAVIAGGAVLGLAFFRPRDITPTPSPDKTGGVPVAAIALILFFALLLALPIASELINNDPLALADSFYRSGSLVFGGGHVVLPLLEAEVVPTDLVSKDDFLAGYGAAQAVPGPLFTFSAYLGTIAGVLSPGWAGGLLALGSIFFPAFLLVFGVLPFWDRLRAYTRARAAISGVNAAVVGILLSALYDPVFTGAITSPEDFALAAGALALLAFWKTPPWLVVVLTGGAGALLNLL